jgi:hypothetical protein
MPRLVEHLDAAGRTQCRIVPFPQRPYHLFCRIHLDQLRRQGNRISKHLQKAVEEVVIPACTFELSAQRTF